MEPLGSGQGAPREDPGSVMGVKLEKGECEGIPHGGLYSGKQVKTQSRD